MKIDDAYIQQAAHSAKAAEAASQAGRPAKPAVKPAGGDEGALSQLSLLVAKALESPQPDRSAKVEALRQLYRSGAYEPDAAALTDALIQGCLK